jgi:hypothetical protein
MQPWFLSALQKEEIALMRTQQWLAQKHMALQVQLYNVSRGKAHAAQRAGPHAETTAMAGQPSGRQRSAAGTLMSWQCMQRRGMPWRQ